MTTGSPLHEAASRLLSRGIEPPVTAVILGSGLGKFASELSGSTSISTAEIQGYPRSTVEGHAGAVHFGRIRENSRSSRPLVVFQGRVHYYESGDLATAVAPVALAAALGVRTLLITNAAGGIDRSFQPGDLMMLDDVVTLNPSLPAGRTASDDSHHQPMFDLRLQNLLVERARILGIPLRRGTYAWVHGPSYETAAEIRMLHALGAHAVGMSTVPEVAYARQSGLRTVGISLISNQATGISATRLSHEEVTSTANQAAHRFTSLVRSFLLTCDESAG